MRDKQGKIASLDANNYNIVELGCGPLRQLSNSITIDMIDLEGVDVVANINEGLGFLPDNSIDEIHSSHFLEHVDNLEATMREIYRVLKPKGKKIGTVPHFANPYFYSDYTHKNFFGLYTFYYMSKRSSLKRAVPQFYNELDFRVVEVRLEFYTRFRVWKLYNYLFNRSDSMKEFYEKNLCYIIPANEIRFILEK